MARRRGSGNPADNLDRAIGEWIGVTRAAAKRAVKEVEKEVRARITLTDHSQADLNRLGNPYRIGSGATAGLTKVKKKWFTRITKRARLKREGGLGHGLQLIHQQSKGFVRSLKRISKRTGQSTIEAIGFEGTDPEDLPQWLLKGTRKMVGRDVLKAAIEAARPRVLAIIREDLNRFFRKSGSRRGR